MEVIVGVLILVVCLCACENCFRKHHENDSGSDAEAAEALAKIEALKEREAQLKAAARSAHNQRQW